MPDDLRPNLHRWEFEHPETQSWMEHEVGGLAEGG